MDALDLPHTDKGPRSASPVILLHGFPLDHTMWAPQAAALEAAGHRVLVPDLRGLGKAPVTKATGAMGAYAEDVIRLADRAGIRRFALAGFSMGGYVAFEVLRRARDRVSGLALVDTRADPDSAEARAGRMKTIADVRANGSAVLADAMLPKLFTSDAPRALVDETRAVILRTQPDGAILALEAIAARPDSTPLLAQLRIPTVVIVGEHDPITPPALSKAMADAIPKAKLITVPGAAHLTTLQAPDAVNAALVAWMA